MTTPVYTSHGTPLIGPWALIGHLGSTLGVGEAARGLSNNLKQLGCDVTEIISGGTRSRAQLDAYQDSSIPELSRVISCVNPDQVGFVMSKFNLNPWKLDAHVGFWSWELPDVPWHFLPASKILDEVWTVSTFCKEALEGKLSIPVRQVRLPVEAIEVQEEDAQSIRDKFGISRDNFNVLLSFDYFSDVRRKNPLDAVAAYVSAFSASDHARLIIKTMNSHHYKKLHETLKTLYRGRPDISFIDEVISEEEYEVIISSANVTLSTHRSEGFGLNLQKAMSHGRIVIATGWSGNMDFMNDTNSIPLPYKLEPVREYGGFLLKSEWAQPSFDYVVDALREVANSPTLETRIGLVAREQMLNEYSKAAAAVALLRQF